MAMRQCGNAGNKMEKFSFECRVQFILEQNVFRQETCFRNSDKNLLLG